VKPVYIYPRCCEFHADAGGTMKLFMSPPPFEKRIAALQNNPLTGMASRAVAVRFYHRLAKACCAFCRSWGCRGGTRQKNIRVLKRELLAFKICG